MHFGFVVAVWFLWDCLWASGGLPMASQHFIQDGVVVGVVWPLPSGLASSHLRTLNNTSGVSSHTPVTEVIKWAWLDIFHFNDVFDVV